MKTLAKMIWDNGIASKRGISKTALALAEKLVELRPLADELGLYLDGQPFTTHIDALVFFLRKHNSN
jgi:hypothetical protein